MRKFEDRNGRTWEVSINALAMKRLKAAEVDLVDKPVMEEIARIASNPILLCDVLFIVSKPMDGGDAPSEEGFAESMSGESLEAATEALIQEIIDFFPRQKPALSKAYERARQADEKIARVNMETVDSQEFDEMIESQIQRLQDEARASLKEQAGKTSIGLQESSESSRTN